MAQAMLESTHAAYLEDFEVFLRERSTDEPSFVDGARRRAIQRFAELGFPTTKMEEWRFTNVSKVAKTAFRRAAAGAAVDAEAVATQTFPGGNRMVFVDGFFSPELSSLAGLPEGAVVDSLAHVLATDPGRLENRLGAYASSEDHPFVALNTAFWADGAYIELPKGTVLEEPVQLVYVTSPIGEGEPRVSYPRTLIVAGEASQLSVVETYAGLDDGTYLTCPVTEILCAPGAVVDHYKLQKEGRGAYHLATQQIHQLRSSNLFSHSIATGGLLVRNDVNAVLDDEGIECTLNGLYVLNEKQFVDNHMRVDHAKPHCNSYELFKGILDDTSRAVFNGRIYVAQDAQKTDAKQSSRNLLLSRGALVNANPQLEIFADDVKCTHGSTVGQLDEDAIFYLRSRGIGERAARSLLTYAFASDIVDRIKIEPVRKELEEFLFARLPRGEVVRQAV